MHFPHYNTKFKASEEEKEYMSELKKPKTTSKKEKEIFYAELNRNDAENDETIEEIIYTSNNADKKLIKSLKQKKIVVQNLVDTIDANILNIFENFAKEEAKNKERKEKEVKYHKNFVKETLEKIYKAEKKINKLKGIANKPLYSKLRDDKTMIQETVDFLDKKIEKEKKEVKKMEKECSSAREAIEMELEAFKSAQKELCDTKNSLEIELINIEKEIRKQKAEKADLKVKMDSLKSRERVLRLREINAYNLSDVYHKSMVTTSFIPPSKNLF